MSVKVRQYRKQPGVWEVDIDIPRMPDGKPYRERVKAPVMGGKPAAQLWARDRLTHLLQHGRPVKAAAAAGVATKEVPTVDEYFEQWIQQHAVADRQKASTIYAKRSIYRAHLKDLIGSKRLDQVGAADFQRIKASLASHSPKTVNNVLSVATKLLRKAFDWELIARPPPRAGLLKVDNQEEPTFYDFGDYARLVEGARKAGPDHLVMVLLSGDAGLREGEVLGLERTDIDFKRRHLHVRRSVWTGSAEVGGEKVRQVVDLPKGGKTRRVPLTDALAGALEAVRGLRKLVLAKADGAYLTPKLLGGMMRDAQRRAQLEETGHTHVLRHTFCSHLAMRGATAKEIQELAGHQDLKTTLRYMHLSPSMKDRAIALLNSRPVEEASPAPALGASGEIPEKAVGK